MSHEASITDVRETGWGGAEKPKNCEGRGGGGFFSPRGPFNSVRGLIRGKERKEVLNNTRGVLRRSTPHHPATTATLEGNADSKRNSGRENSQRANQWKNRPSGLEPWKRLEKRL